MLTIVNYNKDEYNFPALLVLGCFDAIHIGHAELLKQAKLRAKINGLDLGVMMFNTGKGGKQLYSFEERCALLEKYNVKFVLNIDYTEDFKKTTAAQFLDTVEHFINVKFYMSGKDFRFGAGAKGKSATLKKYAEDEENGVWYLPVKDVMSEGEKVSTTLIKECLDQGAISRATQLLGREYSVKGVVSDGHERGTSMGIPTANIVYPENKIQVKQGVYGVDVSFDGNTYKGVANYGSRPTFGEESPVLETYIVDYSGDLYGKEITVSFKNYIRAIRKFDDAEALAAQIHADICRIGEPDSIAEDEPLDIDAIVAEHHESTEEQPAEQPVEQPAETEAETAGEQPAETEPVAEVTEDQPAETAEPAETEEETEPAAEVTEDQPAETVEITEPETETVEEPTEEETVTEVETEVESVDEQPIETAEVVEDQPAETAEPAVTEEETEPAAEVTEEQPAETKEITEPETETVEEPTEEEPVTEVETEVESVDEQPVETSEPVAEEPATEEVTEPEPETAPVEEEKTELTEELAAEPEAEIAEEPEEVEEIPTEDTTAAEPSAEAEVIDEQPTEVAAEPAADVVEDQPAEAVAEPAAEELATEETETQAVEQPAEPEKELTPEELEELEFEREFALLLEEEERENAEKAAREAENGKNHD